MKLKQMTTIAMLTALYEILSIIAPIRLLNFRLTFEAFPILIAGLLYGPLEGFLVGTLGAFIYQLLFSGYGLTVTTIIWIIPHAFSGWLVGFLAKRCDFNLDKKKIVTIAILSAISVTTLNTLALYVDSKVFGYYTAALVFSAIPVKIIAGIILSVIYTLVLPSLLNALKKI